MKYFIYCRKSSEDKDRQIQSIGDQKRVLAELAETRDCEIVHVFQESASAKQPGRVKFNEMMQRIQNGEAQGIICWKLDRLARNPVDGGSVSWALQQNVIQHIITPEREYHPTDNVLMMSVELGMANQFIKDLAVNSKRGMDSKVMKGWMPCLAPLGYLNEKGGVQGEKKIYQDPERFDAVKRMWQMLLAGTFTAEEIRRTANKKWSFRDKKGKPLSNSSIYNLFNNPFYYGYFRWKGELKKGNHPPMITESEFEKAQAILGRKGTHRPIKHNHIYNGLIRCSECGCSITTEPVKTKTNKGDGKVHVYQYLRCTKKSKVQKCSQKYLEIQDLEKRIDELLDGIEISPAFNEWVFRQLRKENKRETDVWIRKRAELQKEYNQNEAMIESLTDNFLKKIIDAETYKTSKQRYEANREHLEEEIKNYEERKDDWLVKIEALFHFAKTAREDFTNKGRNTKRSILVGLGSNLIIKDKKLLLEIKKPFVSIQKAVERERPILQRFGTPQAGLGKAKSSSKEELISIWGG